MGFNNIRRHLIAVSMDVGFHGFSDGLRRRTS
jgi:hypothetical protein